MKEFWKSFRAFAARYQKNGFDRIYSPQTFHAFLERERKRADRTGREFSLVVFSSEDKGKGALNQLLIQVLKSRVRSNDEVGWFDAKRIGVILPETPANGATKVADDIRKTIPIKASHLYFKVYTYPSRWLPASKSELQLSPEPEKAASKASDGSTILDRKNDEGLEQLFLPQLPLWKRGIDLILSTVGLLAFSPITLAIAVAIKLTSRGPVLFKQERTGQGLQRFTMYKFRTMLENADKELDKVMHLNGMSGPLIKIEKDPRLTKIGGFLRKTSLDELPQLFNVLKGDMTIIGPRALSPLPSAYKCWQLRRFTVKPGLACTWQAERRSDTDFEEWMRSDLRYVDNASLLTDLILFVKTVWRVASCRGAR